MEPGPKRPRLSTNWPSPFQQQHPQHPQHPQHHGPPHQHHYTHSLDGSTGAPTPGGTNPSPPIPPPVDDRRHSRADPDPYGRTPSTPTHHPLYQQPFTLRETLRREPGEDGSQPQPQPAVVRRPHSTSDGILPASPNTIPPPSPYTDGPLRHMSGLGHGAHMNPYRPAPFTAPNTMSHHQPTSYDGYPAHHAPESAVYSVYPAAVSKRKATRASQACDSCRSLKAKCDETKPCKGCREKGLECKYRDPIPKATDKAQADILDGLNDVKDMFKGFVSQLGRIETRLSRLETSRRSDPHSDFKSDPDALRADSIGRGSREHSYRADSEEGPMVPPPDEEEEMEERPGPPVSPGEPTIPINHTTLAGLLLGWPTIGDMVQGLLEKEKIEFVGEYPIRQEQERGILRVYGRGEGHDSRHSKDDHGSIDLGDDMSDILSPAADWGQIGSAPFDYRSSNFDSPPDFSPDTVWLYIRSFRENILNLMPLIMPDELNVLVHMFIDGLQRVPKAGSTPVAKGFAVNSPVETTGSKRKRSASPDSSRASAGSYWLARPSRTAASAVVLIAMALGKIAMHKEGVPDVVHTHGSSTAQGQSQGQGSPLFRNGVPASPTQPSPVMRSSSSGLPSPKDWERRRSSHGGLAGRPLYSQKKNQDVIPGLEYFAYATDIIGNQLGGTSMKHVWACVLAGLFHGQLGRVMESYAYICNGSRILQIIMRPSLDRLRRVRENAPALVIDRRRDNQIAFAYWTCLQLESDILAELPLPHSGILSHEDYIPYPNILLPKDSYEPRVFESFMAQLYLRRHLNWIHKMFYHPDANVRLDPGEDDFSDMKVVEDRVRTMAWVSPSFRFEETDSPASDILAARLRAKYWGAQVITYRPFVKQILQFTQELRSGGGQPDLEDYKRLNPRVADYARLGIRALIESTRAFHNLGPDRPIITNVFGTAHAQWGNMLVLGATSLDPFLGQFIDHDLLQRLFTRTLHFLRRSSTATCNLRRDMRILEGVEKHVFLRLSQKQQIYSEPSAASAPGGPSLQNPSYDDPPLPNPHMASSSRA